MNNIVCAFRYHLLVKTPKEVNVVDSARFLAALITCDEDLDVYNYFLLS